LCEIDLGLLDDNPFNSRLNYDYREIELLAQSISEHGLLSPIKVRKKANRYQVVFGHRRVRAMKLLKLTTIPADLCELSDQQMCEMSFAENVSREDLSDYEKALHFEKMNREFGKTYEEIVLCCTNMTLRCHPVCVSYECYFFFRSPR
jgi:ParB family chromosome partitioning protein